jgi:hypothetical protein
MEVNEAKLIERELTLRNLQMTKEVMETRRSIVRWLALALGVISPGETRLSAVSVLDAILYFQFTDRKDPTVPELIEYIGKSWGAINEKTLRYHLLQLKKATIIDNEKGRYFLVRPDIGDKYDADSWIKNYLDLQIGPIRDKVTIAMKALRTRG